MTLFAGVALLVLMSLRRRAIPIWKQNREMIATFYGFLSERLTGTEDIRANGATGYILRRFYLLLREMFPVFRRANIAGSLMGITALFLFIFNTGVALAIGTWLWSRGMISIGTIYVLYAYTDQMSQPIGQIQEQLQDLQQAEACIQRIEELLKTESALPDGDQSLQVEGALAVEFEDVTFGYVAEEPVLANVNVRVEAGRVLGIVGRTGSGKTTLARLLFRLYDAQSGTIRLADVPLKALRLRELRRKIGMVTQDVQLFHASLRDNLTFFNRTIPDARIEEALEDVGLGAWYRALPEGLETMLGKAGEGLSAGEAQLLAFARIFLSNPGLVLLDEASSRLDPATEQRVEHAVNKLFEGRTALVIAHRLATLQRVDDILLLEDGRVVEYGPRESLALDSSSRFSALLRTGLELTDEITANSVPEYL